MSKNLNIFGSENADTICFAKLSYAFPCKKNGG